jgi:hypothetical protein
MRRLPLALAVFFLSTPTAEAAWVWPVKGEVLTSYSNGTDPYAAGQHRGIDIAASVGTPVVAAADGEVRFAGTAGTSGLTISIRTGDGYDTSYLHLSSLAVRPGARVSAGNRIGAVGTTGTRSASAPHLHFGVRDAGTRHAYHDPLSFLPPPPVAPEPNPPAPAPAPTPEPARPAPMPAPAPAGLASPHDAPAPRSAPAPRATPGPRLAPGPKQVPAPAPFRALARGIPGSRAEPHRHGMPVAAAHPHAAPRRLPVDITRTPTVATEAHPHSPPVANGLPSGGEPRVLAQRRDRGLPQEGSAAHPATGPDIGWALACGGLLLAAAILGLTGDRRRAASRRSLATTLRPLVGRR